MNKIIKAMHNKKLMSKVVRLANKDQRDYMKKFNKMNKIKEQLDALQMTFDWSETEYNCIEDLIKQAKR